MVPSSRFCGDPKSAAPEPPPNEAAPTPKSEKPMDVTTTAATMGDDDAPPILREQTEHALDDAAHDDGADGAPYP